MIALRTASRACSLRLWSVMGRATLPGGRIVRTAVSGQDCRTVGSVRGGGSDERSTLRERGAPSSPAGTVAAPSLSLSCTTPGTPLPPGARHRMSQEQQHCPTERPASTTSATEVRRDLRLRRMSSRSGCARPDRHQVLLRDDRRRAEPGMRLRRRRAGVRAPGSLSSPSRTDPDRTAFDPPCHRRPGGVARRGAQHLPSTSGVTRAHHHPPPPGTGSPPARRRRIATGDDRDPQHLPADAVRTGDVQRRPHRAAEPPAGDRRRRPDRRPAPSPIRGPRSQRTW